MAHAATARPIREPPVRSDPVEPVDAVKRAHGEFGIGRFDQDGNLDVFLGGNDYQVNTQLGQLDASQGQVFSLHGKNNLKINHVLTQKFTLPGAIRDIRSINISGEKYKMIARNNDSVELIKLK